MSSFTVQPSTSGIHGVLSELESGTLDYTFETTVTSNTNNPALTVEFWINSAKYREIGINGYNTQTQDGSDYDYTYQIDASKIIKDWFNNTENYRRVRLNNPLQDENIQASLQLKIYVWSPDADGILTKGGVTTNSNTCNVINALQSDLSDYTATSNRKFLSSEPSPNYLITSTFKYLAIWLDNTYITHCKVTSYNENSNEIGSIVFELESSYVQDELCIISLFDDDISNRYTDLSNSSIDASIAHYITIECGTWSDPTFTNKSEVRTYYIINDVYRQKELTFINKLGQQDLIVLKDGEWSKGSKVNYEYYNKRLSGLRSLGGTVEHSVKIELKNLSNENFQWLKELQYSSLFYLDNLEFVLKPNSLNLEDIENNNNIILELEQSIKNRTHTN